jgi:hypothetical protein
VPASVKMAKEYGDDLMVVFCESQNTPKDKTEAFIWDHKWMGTSAIWTNESVFRTGSNGLPNYALLSSTGEILMMGHPGSDHGKIKDAIEEQIALMKKAPHGSPKSLKKAYKEFAKGNYAKAIAEARKVEAKGKDDKEAATNAAYDFIERVEGKLKRVEWLTENGYFIRAQDMLSDIEKATKDMSEVAETIASLTEKLAGDEIKAEVSAASLLAKIEKGLYEDGFDDKIVKRLKKFADKNGATAAGERARHIVKLANMEG